MLGELMKQFDLLKFENGLDEEYRERFSKYIYDSIKKEELKYNNMCKICGEKNLDNLYGIFLCTTCLVNLLFSFKNNYPEQTARCMDEITNNFYKEYMKKFKEKNEISP